MQLFLVILISLVSNVRGHGFVSAPKARNYVAYLNHQDYCPHCLNGPAPTTCGGPGQTNKMMYDSNPTSSFETQLTIKAGHDLMMDLAITANHGGFHSLRLACASGSEKANEISGWIDLERAQKDIGDFTYSAEYPRLAFIPGGCCREDWKGIFQREIDAGNERVSLSTSAYHGAVSVKTYWKIPSNFTCEHAVGQWSWVTANTCTLGMSNQKMSRLMGCTISNSQCSSASQPESFKNCFDIKVTPSDIPVTTEVPVTTEAPVTTEVPVTTQEPVTTEVPVTTEAPVTTEVPVTTQVPVTTDAPVTTQEPLTTEVPVTTEMPESTETPAWNTTTPSTTSQAPATTQTPATVYYAGTWNWSPSGHECSCKQVSWQTAYTTNESCVEALKDGTGDYQCFEKRDHYAFTYKWRSDLGGFQCECGIVTWATPFATAESCVEASRHQCVEERRLEDTTILV